MDKFDLKKYLAEYIKVIFEKAGSKTGSSESIKLIMK
jgi:hypothetical protein